MVTAAHSIPPPSLSPDVNVVVVGFQVKHVGAKTAIWFQRHDFIFGNLEPLELSLGPCFWTVFGFGGPKLLNQATAMPRQIFWPLMSFCLFLSNFQPFQGKLASLESQSRVIHMMLCILRL